MTRGGNHKQFGVTVPLGTWKRLQSYIKKSTPKYGKLTVSNVVADMVARCLEEEGFYDPWDEMDNKERE